MSDVGATLERVQWQIPLDGDLWSQELAQLFRVHGGRLHDEQARRISAPQFAYDLYFRISGKDLGKLSAKGGILAADEVRNASGRILTRSGRVCGFAHRGAGTG